jgi:adenylyltransferase/sulfurtransferase
MLARAGVKELRLIDRDFVEWSNLQRQSLFKESDAHTATAKAVALSRELKLVNSSCLFRAEVDDFNSSNAEDFLAGTDLVLDGSDNFQARYLINDCSVKLGIPWIYGACVGSVGAMAPFVPGQTPCLRCLFVEAPAAGDGPTCDTAGIITPLPKMAAALQVAEGLKILSGSMQNLQRALVTFDLWANEWRRVGFGLPEADCVCCAHRRFEYLHGIRETDAITLCGRNSVQIMPRRKQKVDLAALERRLSLLGKTILSDHLLKLSVDKHDLTVFCDGRAIITGTTDPATAKSLYARYVGD